MKEIVLTAILLAACGANGELVSCECAVEFNSKSPTGARGIFNSSLEVELCLTAPTDPTGEATQAQQLCVTMEDAADTQYAHVCSCNCVHLTTGCHAFAKN